MAVDLAVATTAYSVATAMGASPKVMLSLFEAGLVESGMRNLNYGDRDSLGYLQQRPSQGWPDPTNVTTATKSYVRRAIENEKKHPNYTAGQLAQSVQRSAFPDRYDKREKEARELLAKVSGRSVPGGTGAIIPRDPAGGADGGLLDSLTGIAEGVRTIATGAVNVGGLAATLAKLALPTTMVRVAAGGVGVVCIFVGIALIGSEIK